MEDAMLVDLLKSSILLVAFFLIGCVSAPIRQLSTPVEYYDRLLEHYKFELYSDDKLSLFLEGRPLTRVNEFNNPIKTETHTTLSFNF